MKDQELLEFKPKNLNFKEKFNIWDDKEKKYIRSGTKLGTVQGLQEVNKYIRLTPDEKKIYRRSHKFDIEVVIKGEEWVISLPVTAKNCMQAEIDVLRSMGKEPMQYNYFLKREGTGLTTKWYVKAGEDQGKPVEGVTPTMVVGEESLELTSVEQAYVDALKNKPEAQKYSVNDKTEILVKKAGVDEDRAKLIAEKYF
jgi:hypothetical protein